MTYQTYQLREYDTAKLLGENPNLVGAQLRALWHVQNGDKVKWSTTGPIQTLIGFVNGHKRFRIQIRP